LFKLQSELSIEHEKFRNEQDKKKLLILDINDMRFQQEELKAAESLRENKQSFNESEEDDLKKDDPVLLRIALKTCRQNLTDSMKRLTKMEADYGDVVPRRDYLALETSYDEMKQKCQLLETELFDTKNNFNQLKESYKELESKQMDTQSELESIKGSNTPRYQIKHLLFFLVIIL
jgi:hypothetical protein